MSVIKVKFDRSKHDHQASPEYAYFCDYEVEVGDRVIVDSPYNGYTAVTVSDTSAGLDSIKATKEVVCLIDDSRYNARKQAKARLAEIEAELSYRAERVANTKRLRRLFKGDDRAKSLLRQAEAINHILNDDPHAFLSTTLKNAGISIGIVNFGEEHDPDTHNGSD